MKTKVNGQPIFFLFTCVKNGREYIEHLFDSLLNQTKINFCHYIYDDGSDISMDDIISKYKKKVSELDSPYEVFYERNEINIGLNLATKHCISKCWCDYFIWVNCDDSIDTHFFEEMEKYIKHHRRTSVARCVFYDAVNKTELENNKMRKKRRKDSHQLRNFLYGMYSWSFFAVKNSDYKRINPDNLIINEKGFFNDEQVQLICATNNLKFGFVKKSIGYFYRHGSNESLVNKIKNLDDKYANYQKLISYFDKDLSKKVMYIKELRVLFNDMEENKYINNHLSWEIFKKRKSIIKEKSIPYYLRYRYGNSFTCFAKLLIAKLIAPFKNKHLQKN